MYRTAVFALLIVLGLAGCGEVINSRRKVASEEFALERELANQTRLVLEVTNGNITIMGSIEVSDLELQNLVRTNKTVMGVLGEGNGAITLQTANGRITASGF